MNMIKSKSFNAKYVVFLCGNQTLEQLGAFLIMKPTLTYLPFTTESPPLDETKLLEIMQQNDNVPLEKDNRTTAN